MSHIVTHQVGAFEVTILTDGGRSFPNSVFATTPEARIAEVLAAAGEAEIRTNFNAVLIRGRGRTVLVDTGGGSFMAEVAGNLQAALAEAGQDPAGIDRVFLTHMHVDHFGGAIDAGGRAAFPNADLALTEVEHGFWSDPARFDGADKGAVTNHRNSVRVFAAYEGRIAPLASDAEIAPGLRVLFLPGHTPGQAGFRLEDGGEVLVHVADIVHSEVLQLADPAISVAFDMDVEEARRQRQRMLDEIAADGLTFTGGHILRPALARLERSGEGYRIVR
jgi:glyoxylase-like metal-dependent hydrolase (beta-lactamase superfamily II)